MDDQVTQGRGHWVHFKSLQVFTKQDLPQLAAALASAALAWYSANLASWLISAECYDMMKLWNGRVMKIWLLVLMYWGEHFAVLMILIYWVEYSPVFQLWPEMPDKTLNWPGSAVSQSADGVALNLHIVVLRSAKKQKEWSSNLFAQFPNHVNLLWLCVAFSEPPHHCVHPVNALIMIVL